MELVTPGIGLLFWTFITFIFLVIILKKFVWKKILHSVREREQFISDSLIKAESATKAIEDSKLEKKIVIKEAKEQFKQIIKEAKQRSELMMEKTKKEAKEQSDKILLEANLRLESERLNVLKGIGVQIFDISLQVVEKVLQRELKDKKEQERLVEALLKENVNIIK